MTEGVKKVLSPEQEAQKRGYLKFPCPVCANFTLERKYVIHVKCRSCLYSDAPSADGVGLAHSCNQLRLVPCAPPDDDDYSGGGNY